MKSFAEFWAHTGWKIAYGVIVVVALVLLVSMFM